MKKKIIIIIGIVIIFIVVILLLLLLSINNNNKDFKEKYRLSKPILERINNKDNFLIYTTDNYNKCDVCYETDMLINYYKDIYNLDVVLFDKSTTTDKDFNNLIKDFGLQEGFFTAGDVIFVRNGVIVSAIQEAMFEDTLREYLVEYEFIDNVDNDKFIEDDGFSELYGSNNKELVLAYSSDDNGYNYRKDLYSLSNRYKFKYSVIKIGFGNTVNTFKIVSNKMDNKYELPVLMVVGNNKIIDYTTNKSNSKIEEFLRDNDFI